MHPNVAIGTKIKVLRKEKKLTLKQLSEKTDLSVGFLSQLERGMSNIAIDTLTKIAEALDEQVGTFFQELAAAPISSDPVVHSYNLQCTPISPNILQYILSNNVRDFALLPRMYTLLPFYGPDVNKLELYSHTGEEFIYVLEGIVTVFIKEQTHVLYPGDSIQIHSQVPHNWINHTNKIAKILTINYPNLFPDEGEYRKK